MKIRVAIPIWDGRISPLMDTACRLMIANIDNGREGARTVADIPPVNVPGRADFLTGLNIDVLICGAISHQFEQLLTASGINIRPWFRGNIDEVITAFSGGILQNDNFMMPGCGRRRRGGRGGQCRPNRGYASRGRQIKEDR